MANLCSVHLMVKGNKNNVYSFLDAMEQQGNEYMGRGIYLPEKMEELTPLEGVVRVEGFGECKWSIHAACELNAIEMRTNPKMWGFGKGIDKSKLSFITLGEACKKYNVDFEAYSCESGCCFQEHIVYRNGELVEDNTVSWEAYYNWGDYKTKEELEDVIGPVTNEEWNLYEREGSFERGGFGMWEFEI